MNVQLPSEAELELAWSQFWNSLEKTPKLNPFCYAFAKQCFTVGQEWGHKRQAKQVEPPRAEPPSTDRQVIFHRFQTPRMTQKIWDHLKAKTGVNDDRPIIALVAGSKTAKEIKDMLRFSS